MFVNFSEEVRHLLKQAQIERDNLNHPYVGSEHLFLAILKNNRLLNIFKNYKLTYDVFKEKLVSLIGIGSKKNEFVLYTPLLKRVLENSVIEAREENNRIVSPELIMISILDEEDGVAYSILRSLKINVDKLYYDLRFKKNNYKKRNKKLLIEDIGTDLNKLAIENKLDPVIGRENQIENTIQILLRRKKNNPVLVGPAGVGKTAIVEGIANLLISNDCPSSLKGKRIISLDIFSLVSGTKYRGEFEEKMKTIIKELEENEDIILFIDEVHTIVGAGGAEGAIDASNIFKPALARGRIKVIGATTIEEYKKYIEPDAALARRFQSVYLEEPDYNSLIKILKSIKPIYENYHNVKIPSNIIYEIVSLSSKYLPNRFEPDKSIDVLDESCVLAATKKNMSDIRLKRLKTLLLRTNENKLKKVKESKFKDASMLKAKEESLRLEIDKFKSNKKVVTKNDIMSVIKIKGNLKASINESKSGYKILKDNLNKKIINQENNIDIFINSLVKRDMLTKKRVYSLLITGTPGSGKTFMGITLLESLLDKKDIIKLDLSEYKEYHTISKLLGTTAGYLGYDNKNNIFEKIKTNPSSGMLIENYDKACDEVQQLFKKILEDGFIEDGSGRKIDFSCAKLIFTSDTNDYNGTLGFKNKNNIDVDLNDIRNLVYEKIIINKPDYESKNKIIKSKIDSVIKDYYKANIKIDDNYYNYIYDKNKNENNLKKIISSLEKEIENIIITEIISGKDDIYITKKEYVSG